MDFQLNTLVTMLFMTASLCLENNLEFVFHFCLLHMPAVGILYDGVPREEMVTVHISVTVIIIFLACCGIILTAACLVFNFVFRERR